MVQLSLWSRYSHQPNRDPHSISSRENGWMDLIKQQWTETTRRNSSLNSTALTKETFNCPKLNLCLCMPIKLFHLSFPPMYVLVTQWTHLDQLQLRNRSGEVVDAPTVTGARHEPLLVISPMSTTQLFLLDFTVITPFSQHSLIFRERPCNGSVTKVSHPIQNIWWDTRWHFLKTNHGFAATTLTWNLNSGKI